jgi:predicted MFS family arabinose efflux permease
VRQGRAIGFNESGPNVGNTLAFPLTVSIMSAWSWRAAFLILSIPAFALSMVTLLLMKEEPKVLSEQVVRGNSIWEYWRLLLPFAVAHGVYNLVLRAAFTFTPLFLVEYRGMDVASAGLLATALPLAGILAKVSSGFIAEKAGSRLSICGATAFSALFLASLVALPSGSYVAINLVALGLTVYSFSPIIYASTTASLPSGLKATGLGAVTMLGNMVGVVSTSIVGALIDSYGYGFAFSSIAVVTLAATYIIYMTLKSEVKATTQFLS